MNRREANLLRGLILSGALALTLHDAWAQALPGAGDALRTLPPPPALPNASAPSAAAALRSPAPAPSVAGLQGFELKEVRFTRTEAIGIAELQGLAAPYLNRRVDAADLAAFALALQQRYEARGFGLVSIALPSQNLTQGTLNVAIVEPRLGRVSVVQGAVPPIDEARALGLLSYAGLQGGHPLSLQQLDRAMFSINDLPGVAAKATLTPSGDEGVFDLIVQTEPRRAWDLAIDLDNHGSKSTGTWRVGGLARWNNPLHIGDNLDLRLLTSDRSGLTLGRLAYELPVGYTPWRASFGASQVDYQLGKNFSALEANGVARVGDAAVSYPVFRSRTHNLIARLGVEYKDLEDRFDSLSVRTNKNIRDVVFGLSFEGRDNVFGGGFNGASVQAQFGNLRIATDDVRVSDEALGSQATQGRFSRLNVQVSRLQQLQPSVLVYAGLTGQWASKNLDGAEKLTLGGASAVRAYPAAEAPSDQGLIASVELRYFINAAWTVFGLYDWAKGWERKRPDPATANTRVLDSTGFGLHFTDPRLFTLKATLAWHTREQPLSEAGNDGPRLYVQVQRPF